MKKQYVMAMLLLIGFGIVSTMAFTLNTPATQELPKVYSFASGTQTTGEVSSVRITPFLSADGIRFKVGITKGDATKLTFDLDDGTDLLDLSSGYTFEFKDGNDQTTYTSTGIVSTGSVDGHIEVPLTASDATIYFKIEGTDVYSDIEGLIIGIE